MSSRVHIGSVPQSDPESKYKEAEGALVGELRRVNAEIAANRELTIAVSPDRFFPAV